MRQFVCFIMIIFVTSCNDYTSSSKVPLIAKDTTKKLERENTLIAFVGEKISLKDMPYYKGAFDNAFLATYRILQRVYGEYQSDTITFRVLDHFGIPEFTKYRHVLLYVSSTDSFYYHEKYQYNDVYKTKDGRWAGSYTNDYDNLVDSNINIKPEIIPFENDVYYPISENNKDYVTWFPEPYFKIEGKKIKVVYGNYLEDLFLLKKNGVLSYRGLFGDTLPVKPVIPDIELEEIKE